MNELVRFRVRLVGAALLGFIVLTWLAAIVVTVLEADLTACVDRLCVRT